MTLNVEIDMILINKVIDGNHAAQRTLYDSCKKTINNYIKGKYPNSQDIDDDTSEVLMKIFLNLRTFDINKSKFNSWIISIAKNYMIDKWRSNPMQFTALDENDNNDFQDYDDVFIPEYTNTTLKICSNNYFETDNDIKFELTSCEYAMVNMKYIQGYSYKEIGKEFNLTSSTASNKVNYIKSKIKKNHSESRY